MNRRNLIKLAGISIAAQLSNIKLARSMELYNKEQIIKPRSLKEGDTVGIISPATAVTSPEDIEQATSVLKLMNLKPIFPKNFFSKEGYKTRSPKLRADDVNEMFANQDVKAIFCIRGGYGSGGILPFLDYKIIQNNPKIFVGYSDITAMHLAINKITGLSTLHGAVLLSDFEGNTFDLLKKALFTNEPLGVIANPTSNSIKNENQTRTIISGSAKGQLLGGNLSLIVSLMGTKYEIDTNNKILFLEDVGEEPYRVDRMLTQLKLAGKFDNIAGLVFGKCQDCSQKSVPAVWDYNLAEVLDFQLKDINKPVFYGLLIGHTSIQYPLPLNVEANLDADKRNLTIVESFCENS
jgi:muramoyltetrapeptide carboxypeptidase